MITVASSNPFPGLRPFEARQADFFFGRDEQIEELLERLDKMRFVAVLGTSGSGKSSLVRAGLIPALERGYFGGENWHSIIVRPGSDPIAELAVALSTGFNLSGSETLSTLRRSSLGLAEFAGEHLPSGRNLLIVIDQFEELIRYRKEASERGGKEESAAFVKLLLAATGHSELPVPESSDLHIYVVLTMRSDFLGKCSQFRGLPEALNDSQYLVPRMTREQQREVIEGPLGMAGTRITPQLIQKLLNDVGDSPDQLPVLQHALMRMWEQSSEAREQGKPIDLPHYESVGRMERALNLDADRAFGDLGGDPSQETIARRLFQLLVEPGADAEETRRPSLLSEIVAVTGAQESNVRQVITVFERKGFVTLSEDADPVVDISHESLIRLWDRLKGWVKEESDSAETYIRLADSATKGMALYRDPELTQALRWRERESPSRAWAERYSSRQDSDEFFRAIGFLERSRKAAAKEQWMRRAVVLGLCLLSAALGVVAFVAWWNAKNASKMAQSAFESAVEARRQRANAESSSNELTDALGQAISERWHAEEQRKKAETALVEAERQRSLAESARRDASARQLAAQAVTLLRDDPSSLELSTLLSTESMKRKFVLENDQALRTSLEVMPGRVLVLQKTASDEVAFSANGRHLAIASLNGTVRVFEAATGIEVGRFSLKGPFKKIEFSPGGYSLATAGPGNTTSLYELTSGKEIWSIGQPDRVLDMSFSGDGRFLCTRIGTRTARVLDTGSGREVSSLTIQSTLHTANISPDGRYVATGSDDGTVQVFETRSGREIWRGTHFGIVSPIAFSKDGRFFSAVFFQEGAANAYALVFEALTGKELFTLGRVVNSVAFSPDGRYLATGNVDGTARVMDAATGVEVFSLTHSSAVGPVVFSPDGRYIATGSFDHTVRLFSPTTGWEVSRLTLPTPANYVAFSPGGLRVIAVTDGVATVFEAKTKPPIMRLQEKVFNLSPDGRYLSTANISSPVLDLASGKPVVLHPAPIDLVGYARATFSPDGRYVLLIGGLASSIRGISRLFDLVTGKEEVPSSVLQTTLSEGEDRGVTRDRRVVTAWGPVAFSLDGRYLVSRWGKDDLVIQVSTGKEVARLSRQNSALALSPDGRYLAVGNDNGTASVVNVATGAEMSRLAQYGQKMIFSPDGRYVATDSFGTKTVHVFEVATATETSRLSFEYSVQALAFTQAGRFLRIVSYSEGINIVRDYPLVPQDLIAEACSRLTRNLTRDEWKKYVGDEPYQKTCPNLPSPEGN